MVFGLGRLHFIREEDKLCAKFSALFILSGLWRASGDSGKQCECQQGGGVTHPWLGQTLSCSSCCIVCRPHGSLKVSRSAQRWWITYRDWKSSRVSCFLLCPTVCLLLDTVWSPLSADLLQAVLQIQPACTGNVWLISHIEDYVDY